MKELNHVIVSGYDCIVQSVTSTTIVCQTSSIEHALRDLLITDNVIVSAQGLPSFRSDISLNSSRDYGSPGWWLHTWSLSNYYSNQMTDQNVLISMGYRGDSLFSFYYLFGSDWEQKAGVGLQTFAAQLQTYLVAPMEGYYSFYLSSDDNSFLYCKKSSEASETTLFNNIPYSDPNAIYTMLSARRSSRVYLNAGERLKLRAVLINTNTIDYISLGLRIDPVNNVSQINTIEHGDGLQQYVNLQDPVFMHHHSLRDIQVLTLSIDYQREVQTLVISNVVSGSFRIILQNMVVTDPLTFTSSSSEISNALYHASLEIPSASRLCSSFGVSRSFANSGTTMFVRIEFYCDNSIPLPLIYAYTADLVFANNNETTFTQRNQLHTPIPSGNFLLDVPLDSVHGVSENNTAKLFVPYNSSADSLRNLVQSLSSNLTVCFVYLNYILKNFLYFCFLYLL